jgi:peroxiredoxin Q/BCP
MSLLSILKKDLHSTHLKVGDKAPFFKGVDDTGKEISLDDFKGKKVVLYFYPKDNTLGCTTQSCNLSDNYELLQKRGYQVIGVSADSVKSHQNFKKKYKLPFPLIADIDKKIISAYDVWGNKFFLGRNFDGIVRTTFIISEAGIIEDVITKVDTKNHTEQIVQP